MNKINLKAKDMSFEALLIRAVNPTHRILFAAGSGGNPERYLPLLTAFAEKGCTVIAPYFERIPSSTPSQDELTLRGNVIKEALDSLDELSVPTVGVGHSIGATLLVALAGGQMWMRAGYRLPIRKDERFKKLVLFTPPTGYFQAPMALKDVQTPIQVWAGSLDTITPSEQIDILKRGLPAQTFVDLRIAEGAGHFSFMNTLPPNIKDSIGERENFLSKVSEEVCRFVMT